MNTKESILGCFVSSVNGDINGDLFFLDVKIEDTPYSLV